MQKFLIYLNLITLIGLSVYVFTIQKQPQQGFILNQEVFTSFKGTAAMELKLNQQKEKNRITLDSLSKLVVQSLQDERLVKLYYQREEEFKAIEQQLSEQYTADIWKHINSEIAEYGREENYGFIFGASGTGSLMYAGEEQDITKKIIAYLNSRYEGTAVN